MAVNKQSFAKKFAENGQRTVWEEPQYKLGWDMVGIRPPTKEQFNYLFYNIDEKMTFLLDEFGKNASTTQAGIVQLSSATNSDREDMAATPKAVKAAYDKAVKAAANDLPSGAVMYFAGQTAPAGWLKADGAAVSRTTYAALFAAIGTTYGAGDGRNTFNLPDLRAEFVRGWDDGRGVDSGRAFGSAQGHAVANHYHPTGVFWSDNDDLTMPRETEYGNKTSMQAGDPAAVVLGASQGGANQKNYHLDANLANNKGSGNNWTLTTRTDHMTVAQGGGETRPRNIALLACIKI